jgi:hypothetical protein
MTYLERDLERTLNSVADGVSLRPEEESAMLAALLGALDGSRALRRVPYAAWRWLGATLMAFLMLFSMMSPWPAGHVALAQACITPEARVTPQPAPTSLLTVPAAGADPSLAHLRPNVVAAPLAEGHAMGNATLPPGGVALSSTS